MGPFANLMERVEYIGKATGRRALLGNGEIVYRYYEESCIRHLKEQREKAGVVCSH